MRLGHGFSVAIAVLLAVGGIAAGQARATTFCVPGFHAACPNAAGNVAEADVEKAMATLGKDGSPDRVVIAAGTFTETGAYEPEAGSSPETFEPLGFDPLEVIGAGAASTVLTSAGTGNVFVVNLASNNTRAITIRNLTIRVPASFQDPDGGAAVYLYGNDVLDGVDLVSLNPGADGAVATGAGNVFRRGEVRGEGATGSIANAFSSSAGNLLVEDAVSRGASWGLVSSGATATLTARRVRQVDTGAYGVFADGGTIAIENSTIGIDDGVGLIVSPAAENAAVTANHITVVNSGGSPPALEAKKFGSGPGSGSILLSNSIMRGFASGYKAETAIGPGVGHLSITARYSDLPASGSSVNGAIDLTGGNIDADPLLGPDLALPAGSPALDAGDPAPGGLAVDLLGAPRPADGDGDGVARRDMGAFEYQPPVPAGSGGGEPGSDATPPQTRIVKGPAKKQLAKRLAVFRFRSSEGGSSFRCQLDRRKVARCKTPKRYPKLKPGRHAFRVWAVDAAGNKDPTPAKRRFRVPVPKS